MEKIKRRFTGKLSGFKDKYERNFYKKALKAYIKGKERFVFGKDHTTNKPMQFYTPQEFE